MKVHVKVQMMALVALLGCGNLPSTDDGVVELRVTAPASLVLRQGEFADLTARAFDRNGEEVAAAVIIWATPDASIAIEPAAGPITTVVALDATGTGRVQASVGTLRSDVITFTLQPLPGLRRD